MNADKLRELNDRLLTCGNDCSDVLLDGAAEIERLRAENERLRGWIASLDNEAEGLHQRLAAFADNNETLRARVAELTAACEKALLELGEGWDGDPIDNAVSILSAALSAKEGDESEGERMKRAYGLPAKEGE